MVRIIFCFLFSLSLEAGTGIVTVLEAPIFREPDLEAKVVQLVRKGQKVYIHNKYFKKGPLELDYVRPKDVQTLGLFEEEDDGFYLTSDKRGMDAYIPKEYIKLVYRDRREFSEQVVPFKPDPTDYRLEEPLPEGYPVVGKTKLRASISLSIGSDLKSNYAYPQVIEKEEYGNRWGMYATYAKKTDWDKENRFYVGGAFHIWGSKSRFTIFDDGSAEESKGQVGLGPYLSYDVWRSNDFFLTISGALTVNYNRMLVSRSNADNLFEQRTFKGFSFTPRISSYLTWKNLFPFPVQLGFDFQTYLPHYLASTKEVEVPELWNEQGTQEDQWYVPFSNQWSVYIGIIKEY